MPWTYVDEHHVSVEQEFDRDIIDLCRNLDYLLTHDLEAVGNPGFEQNVAEKLQSACTVVMPFSSIHKAFASWAKSFVDSNDLCLLRVLEQVATWLLDKGNQLVLSPSSKEAIPDEQDRLGIEVGKPSVQIPRLRPQTALFLHFFSGHRRMHDLQWWLEKVHEEIGVTIEVASIDIVISESICDLTSKGQTTLKMVGQPWGLWDLRADESAQVETGLLLLGFALEAMLSQPCTHGFGALERPRRPQDFMDGKEQAPSIWNLAVMRWLISTQMFTLLHVEQGHHGASSRKPTTLLLCGTSFETAPELERSVRSTATPSRANIGRDGSKWENKPFESLSLRFLQFSCSAVQRMVVCQSKRSSD